MPEARPRAAAALRESRDRLQRADQRVAALAEGVQTVVGALLDRLDALPAAAGFEPFAHASKAPADTTAAPRRQRRPVQPAGQPLAGTSVISAQSDQPGTRPTQPQRQRWLHDLPAFPQTAAAGATQRRRTQPPPTPSDAPATAMPQSLRDAGAAAPQLPPPTAPVQARAAQRPAALASRQGPPQSKLLSSNRLIETQLEALVPRRGQPRARPALDAAIASVQAAMAGLPAAPAQQRAAVPTPSQAEAAPASLLPGIAPAPRAPSRLLGTPPAAGATASAAGTPSLSSTASAEPEADSDELLAAMNRALIDQAWLRGVDLR